MSGISTAYMHYDDGRIEHVEEPGLRFHPIIAVELARLQSTAAARAIVERPATPFALRSWPVQAKILHPSRDMCMTVHELANITPIVGPRRVNKKRIVFWPRIERRRPDFRGYLESKILLR
jgi:hypothetical protein